MQMKMKREKKKKGKKEKESANVVSDANATPISKSSNKSKTQYTKLHRVTSKTISHNPTTGNPKRSRNKS